MRLFSLSPVRSPLLGLLPWSASALLLAACGARSDLDGSSGPGDFAGGAGAHGGPSSGAGGANGGTGGAGPGGPAPQLPPGCWPELPGPKLVKMELPAGSFCIDATEVTNRHYKVFLDSSPDLSGQRPACTWNDSFVPWERFWPAEADRLDHPVAGIDFCDADAYCRWAGKRLCGPRSTPDIHDEWRAACTHDGDQHYPYGHLFIEDACNGRELGVESTLPVGSLPTCEGAYPGLFDLVGNLGEWIDECTDDGACTLIGGSWWDVNSTCEEGFGFPRDFTGGIFGIRCCRDAE